MEHILQFGVSIDENAIVKAAEDQAARALLNKVNGKVSEITNRWGGEYVLGLYKDEIKRVVNENKETIIERSIKELVYNLSKTKAVKEALGEVIK